MSSFAGKVAVITGAGSGIGRALAIDLAARGAKLVLSDIDADSLAETVRAVTALSAQVKADRLNGTERDEVLAYADDVVAHFGTVHQVYNNPASLSTATSRIASSRTSNGSWTSTSGVWSTAPKRFCRM
jgi:NAD(P)-dependent dehydrogenase (short-subunit alcohol dehydrogenase family)